MMARVFAFLSLAVGLMISAPLAAQQGTPAQSLPLGAPTSAILTIDSDRVFRESLFGRRVVEEVEAQAAVLTSELRQIEADLEAEEIRLTEQRQTMSPDEFQVLADAFDKRFRTSGKRRPKKNAH